MSLRNTEYATYSIEYGIDFAQRRVYFGEISGDSENDIDWKTIERVIRSIHVLERLNPKKPIELHMSSGGGDCVEMLRLYDVIQSCQAQIICIAGGLIASSASWILAGSDKRLIYPNTKVLIHDGPSGLTSIPAKAVDLAIDADDQARIQKRLNELYAKNSRMPIEFWTEFTKRDLWLTAEECIMLGLADEIIEPKKRGNLRKSRIASLKNQQNIRGLKSLVKSIKERTYANKNITLEIKLPEEEFDKNLTIDPTPETILIVDKDVLATIKE